MLIPFLYFSGNSAASSASAETLKPLTITEAGVEGAVASGEELDEEQAASRSAKDAANAAIEIRRRIVFTIWISFYSYWWVGVST